MVSSWMPTSAMICAQPAPGTAPTAAMPPGMSSKCRSSDGDSSWCVGWISCGGRRQVGRQASTPRGRVAEGIRRGRRGGGRAQCRCQGGCAAHVVGADRHAEERDHADAAVLDLNHAPPVQSRLVGAQAQRIPNLALRRAAEDRVVDATDQILNRHAHRSARGRAGAQGRALESSRRAEQRKHLKGERKNCQVRVTKNEGG